VNYRHVFHAGNFADLLKHAVLTTLMADLTRGGGPLTVIDTHAGAGVYDLSDEAARRTGEASAILRLMADDDAPAVFESLKGAVREANGAPPVRHYPGSPSLIARALRPRDRLIACETRRDDYEILREALRSANAEASREDGWEAVRRRTPRSPERLLVHIDPPFEAADDGLQAARAVGDVLTRNPGAIVAIWTPIKDLAGFDALVSGVEEASAPVLVVETRLRRPDDPLRLNGCAMLVVNPTFGLEALAGDAAAWISATLGEAGGLGRAQII
jgi:23S rRNA (adenine2030-N6)-methyltransferase